MPPTQQCGHERGSDGRCDQGAPELQGQKSQTQRTEGEEIEAVTSTRLRVFISLCLLNNIQSRCSIPHMCSVLRATTFLHRIDEGMHRCIKWITLSILAGTPGKSQWPTVCARVTAKEVVNFDLLNTYVLYNIDVSRL